MDVVAARESEPKLGSESGWTAEAIVTIYFPLVHRFAVMVSPASSDAEDLAQDAMLLVLERLDQFDPLRGRMEPWLWGIVVNSARDAGRASRRRDFLIDRLIRERHADLRTRGVDEAALEAIRDRELLEAVRRLPRRYRTLVGLRYGAGMTSVETAAVLGITRMAVAKATRRALDRLRQDVGRGRNAE